MQKLHKRYLHAMDVITHQGKELPNLNHAEKPTLTHFLPHYNQLP